MIKRAIMKQEDYNVKMIESFESFISEGYQPISKLYWLTNPEILGMIINYCKKNHLRIYWKLVLEQFLFLWQQNLLDVMKI